ncbi:MAG: putative peptidoglycan glycosyltransferase FtsW, partial [Calditrichota bacterium]
PMKVLGLRVWASDFNPHPSSLIPHPSERFGDEKLLIVTGLLVFFGLLMVYSSSGFIAAADAKPDYYYFFKQIRILLVGILAFLMGARVNLRFWKAGVIPGMIVLAIVMTAQLFFHLGPIVNGARRWVNFGLFNMQTSEVARCLIIVFLALVFSKRQDLLQGIKKQLFIVLLAPALFMLLTLRQPDLSSAAVMGVIVVLMLFLGGFNVWILGSGGIIGLGAGIYVARHNPYQWQRIVEWLSGDNYQLVQSLVGFARGKLFGVGLNQGLQKWEFLPEPHTDFIFSIIAEEWGLIGTLAVLGAFIILFLRAIKIAGRQPDAFGFLLGAGLAGSLVILALVNIMVAIGLVPVTGLPLPFISSGGTSLVVSLWSMGILAQLGRRAEQGEF